MCGIKWYHWVLKAYNVFFLVILFWFKDEDSGWYLILIKIIIYIFQYGPLTSRQKKQIDVGCWSRHMYVAQPGRAICCPLWHWPITKPKHPEREICLHFELKLGLSIKTGFEYLGWNKAQVCYGLRFGMSKISTSAKMQYFVSDFCAQNLACAYSYLFIYLVVQCPLVRISIKEIGHIIVMLKLSSYCEVYGRGTRPHAM